MAVGEKKTISIPTQEAYGEYRENLKQEVPRSYFQSDFEPQVGQQVQLDRKDGQSLVVLIASVTADAITIDANHPLAGQDLNFEIQLVKIA
jgi:peptidylprolyl isomerase